MDVMSASENGEPEIPPPRPHSDYSPACVTSHEMGHNSLSSESKVFLSVQLLGNI